MSYMRSAERQRQILVSAKRVFAERGFHAANISHICAAAGIGRGTLYQYFTSKKDVFAAIIRDILGAVRREMESRPPASEFPPPEQVSREAAIRWSARRLRRLLGAVFQDEQTLRILLREAVGLDVDIEHLLSEIDDGIIGLVERDLIEAQAAGFVRPLNPRLSATLMVGAIEKAALAALRSDAPLNLDELAHEAAQLHGIGTLSDRMRAESSTEEE